MTDLVSLLFIAMILIDCKITNFSLHFYWLNYFSNLVSEDAIKLISICIVFWQFNEYICDPILENRRLRHSFQNLFYWIFISYRNRWMDLPSFSIASKPHWRNSTGKPVEPIKRFVWNLLIKYSIVALTNNHT